MALFGYKLMTEEHGPKALVENTLAAEKAGFDFVSISDHFHPWLESQGHSPFAWSVLGAIAHATSRIDITTGLTCPIIRYHPALVAQAAATIAIMSDNRFSLSLGAGERLNEHVTGAAWPSTPVRHEMLAEAIDMMRLLWDGRLHSFEGQFFDLDHAQLYDAPQEPITVTVGVSGLKSVGLAAEKADGIMATAPDADLITQFSEKSGRSGPAYGEAALAWAPTEEEGRRIAHERFRFSAFEWAVNSELRDVQGFEAATKYVRPEDLADSIPAGPDPEVHLAAIRKWIDAGFDHVVLVGPGDDQAGFIRFCETELFPRLR
ncbi:TIGR03557 family F420-dependent LLM class oxidoreductase [Novosphingobium malaysiense]|uniref:5,10-methylene tetrahydromethanopterin reductase n=1 Tax=Novosphingobium malaysiense TaxID=1348853 RepID=A0A0B1ZPA6_9SPHN|nr:TIGR03557 family F420-dependent LLM class oxidoreductase [Novosphingobium malaysiense]KHK91083.1 5,10-methylene tetrahydromethanopterin reductase [Novosphingobium malaysiense]